MVVLPVLFLLGSLFHCGRMEGQSADIENLKMDALTWNGNLPCDWDCDCAFNYERSCCCAANDMFDLEDEIFEKMTVLWHKIATLKYKVHDFTDSVQIAFKATMHEDILISEDPCFGPFNANVSLSYGNVTLNHGDGYNPSLGVFTAPCAGAYVFSFTVYSYVEENDRLYHKVQLMTNNIVIASVWENNREDNEDIGSHEVVLMLNKGDQVYTVLMSGRRLCRNLNYNSFSGYILYPTPHSYTEYEY